MERLKTEPQRFTLGQALRLIGFTHARTLAEWDAFIQGNVYVRPWLSLAFPPSELLECEERETTPRFSLTATGFGLYSTMGPLPTFYTEELLDRMIEMGADSITSNDPELMLRLLEARGMR